MQSNLKNRSNEQVVQLFDPDNNNLMYIQPGGSVPFLLVLAGNTLYIPLSPAMYYNINRIRIILYAFTDEAGTGVAFPKWEQFAIKFSLTLNLTDVGGSVIQTLIRDLRTDITDGITSDIIFKEPFNFQTSAGSDTGVFLQVQIDPTGSIFNTLTGMVVPPPAGLIGITVLGSIFFEGVSYSLPAGQIDAQKIIDDNAAAGVSIDNILEIDI